MSKFIKKFVTGHGINFESTKRNELAFEQALILWRSILEELTISNDSVVMFCGAKNNGKSSLVRYVANKLVSSEHNFDCVYYIDCDPGQPEMNVPGLLSANLISKYEEPLCQPPYLNHYQHQQVAATSVGGTNMSVNPKLYIDGCDYLVQQVNKHKTDNNLSHPVLINTSGFIRNVGLAILLDMIKLFKPTNIVVLNVRNDPMRTIHADLNASVLKKTKFSFMNDDYNPIATDKKSSKLNYKCHIHDLDFSFIDSSTVASKNRTAHHLAHVAKVPGVLFKPVMLAEPKFLSLDNISIQCISSWPLKESIIYELLQNSWVHLVKLKDEETKDDITHNHFLACGIVTNVDLLARQLSVVTPLGFQRIPEVNCVIKPLSIQVPTELYDELLFR